MKNTKSTRTKKPAMTAADLLRLRREMNYDKASLSLLLDIPYRTLQDYEAGERGIPASFAGKMKAAHKADRRYMAAMSKALDKEFARQYPHGIRSEIIINNGE
jgi:hypothetical protein